MRYLFAWILFPVFMFVAPFASCGDGRWSLLGPGEGAFIHDIEFADSDVFVTSDASGIFKSADGGQSWTPMNDGLSNKGIVANADDLIFFNPHVQVLQFEVDGNDSDNMYASSGYAFIRSRDGGEYWEKSLIATGIEETLGGAERSYRFSLDPDIPGIIYLMRFNGDFFISEDFGASFEKISTIESDKDLWYGLQTIDYKNLKVDPLSPVDSRRLFFACGGGFFVSEDGGKSWRKEVEGLPYYEIVGMDILVRDGEAMIFAAVPGRGLRRIEGKKNHGGLYVTSEKDGFKWRKLSVEIADSPVDFNANLYGIVVSHKKSASIYTANSNGRGADILRSSDFGETWQPIFVNNIDSPGWIYHPEKESHICKLSLNPENSKQIWIRSWRYGLLKTEDGGATWENVYSDVKNGKNANRGLHTYWGTSVMPDKTDPERIYIGLTDFGPNVSNDDGKYWSLLHPPGQVDAWIGMRNITDGRVVTGPYDPFFEKIPDSGWSRLVVKPDWQRIEFDVDNPECFYVSTGLGTRLIGPNRLQRESMLLKTENRGKSFYLIKPGPETGLPAFTAFTDLLSLPETDDFGNELWVAAGWKGIYRSLDGGNTFTKITRFNESFEKGDYHGIKLTADPEDSNRIYLSCGTGMRCGAEHTRNEYIYNQRYYRDFEFQNRIPEMIDGDILRVTAQGGLWMTPDRGRTWRKLTEDFANVRNLRVDPFNSAVLYLAVIGHKSGENVKFMEGGVYKSTDGGETWERVFDQPLIRDVAVHPTRKNWIFAASVGWAGNMNPGYSFGILLDDDEMRKAEPGVYLSKDGGESWTNISGNLDNITHTFKRITLKEWKPDSLFITTSSGILRYDIE